MASRDKEVMHKTANKMAMGEMSKMPPTYSDVFGGINEKAVSKKQQRFFGMVRAKETQKGEMENPSPEVAKVAATAKRSDVKDFAKTKHKGLPMKKKVEEANKSGDNSLRDWFGKSKSSDGKLVGCNSVVNMQENPVQNNQDKQQNPSAVLQR